MELQKVISSGGRAFLALPTGFGKTKIALDYLSYVKNSLDKIYWKNFNVVVVTYTIQNQLSFIDEIVKWNKKDLFSHIRFITYVSLHKIKGKNISVLILDEAHHLTIRSFSVFLNNNVKRIIALSATPPVEIDKINLFNKLHLKYIYRDYNDALGSNRISDFKIHLYGVTMDAEEIIKYKQINQTIDNLKNKGVSYDKLKWYYLKRMKFLHNVKARQEKTKVLMNSLEGRKIVFVSSIKQAEALSTHTYHSKRDDRELKDFMLKKINTLVSVQALDEAVNLPDVDVVIISSFFSKERRIIQRIGRGLRNGDKKLTNIYIIYIKDSIEVDKIKNALTSINSEKIDYK